MKKYYLSPVLLGIFGLLCSCGPTRLQTPQTLLSADISSYCELLRVPAKPSAALEPKPFLGIYMATRKLEQPLPGCGAGTFVQVAGVINGTPASKAGLRNDDVVLSLNNTPVCGTEEQIIRDFKKKIEAQKIGAPITLNILRGKETLALSAVLEELPTYVQPEARHQELEQCPPGPSLLDKALTEKKTLPRFDAVLAGLNDRSNVIHNPGAPAETRSRPLQMRELTFLMRRPLEAGAIAKELSRQLTAPLEEQNWQSAKMVQQAAALLDLPFTGTKQTEITFPALLRVMEETTKGIDQALSNLTTEEKALLRNNALDSVDDEQWNRILEISLKVDRAALLAALSPLLDFLTRDNLSLLQADLVKRFGKSKEILYESTTPVGKVIVGGPGPNVYREDAALILDLGGDDLYLNNAGGTRPGMPLSLVIDWGGNDRYLSRENFSQGAAVLGAGMLIDLGGNDAFTALDGSQGAGFWGFGLLYHGDGGTTFSARKVSQGTGQMGLGLLINRKGESRYLCSYGGQGLGFFGGAGIVIDEAGNDLYRLGGLEPDFREPLTATQSFGQGFGLGERPEKDKYGVPGGVGMLIDASGDDTYLADYFAQGSSYYYGLGILDDRAGNDQYICGRYCQGAGIHSSVGILVDRRGDDFYYASVGVGQGLGHDFGAGILEDEEGKDFFQGGTLVQGAATNGSFGLLMDLSGRSRFSFSDKGQAYAEDDTGMGIVIKGGVHAPDIRLGVRKE